MERKSRNTKQKELLCEELDRFNSFFTAEELLKKANKIDSKIGIATIYRFLNKKTKNKALRVYRCNRRLIYSKDKNSHCHYICEKTGKIIHFNLDNLDFLKKIKDKIPGSIKSIQLEIRGECSNCQ